jgi:hypothetical protein
MGNKLKKIFLSYLFALFIVAIPTFITLLRPGYFPMHDDISAMRLLEMDKCIKDGQIPCRWVPDMGYGYGYPQFNYYAPLPYYIMEVFHLGGLGFLDSVKAGFILSFILSGMGMYLLGKSLWGKPGGFVAALLYLYLPYRAYDAFVRGAVGELYAFAFLPFIFLGVKKTLAKEKRAILLTALSSAALFTSHNITSMILLPFLLAWTVFIIFEGKLTESPDFKKRIFDLAAGLTWGLGLSAFFTLPAFFERNLVHIDTLTGGYFDYLAHFVSFGQLLFSNYWGYAVSEPGPWDEISLSVGLLHWTLALLAVALAVILKARKKITQIVFWLVLGLVCLFMAHAKSIFVWKLLPFSAFIQFPWRYLLPAGFFFCLAGGALGQFFPKDNKKIVYASVLVLFVIVFYSTMFRPVSWLNISDEQKFSGQEWKRQQTVSLFDYLPIGVEKGPTEDAPPKPIIASGQARILDWQKGSDFQKGRISVSENSRIGLPIYFFPNWEVLANAAKLNIRPEGELGLISFDLEKGEWEIKAHLRDTPIRTAGNLVSLLSLITIPLYLKKR